MNPGQNGHSQTKKRDIHFWVMPNVGFSTRSVLHPLISEFERTHPDVRVILSIHPWSLAWNRLIDVIKGRYVGPTPDVLQIGTTHVATLAYLGALDKIPDASVLPQEDAMSAYIWDPGMENSTGQELYCVPWFIDVRVLYYRKDLFEKAGVPVELLQDWKGFSQACATIQQFLKKSGPISKVVAPLAIPGQKPGVLMHDLAPWVWGAGGDFCSDDLVRSTFDSPASLRGCQTYFDLIHQGYMPIPDSGLPRGNFFTGHYAMQLTGSWPAESYLNPANPICTPEVVENFGVTLFPAGPQGRFTFLGGSNLAVSAMSPQRDLSWEFVRFMSEPERQRRHAQGIGALTARLASLEELFTKHPAAKKVFWDSFGHARRLPRLVELGSIEQIVYKLGSRVLSLIRNNDYNVRLLEKEIASASNGINAVLSLHRYGSKTPTGRPA